MRTYKPLSDNIWYITAIIIYIFIVHGFLLINDGIYWDDWLWINPTNNHLEIDRMVSAANEMGTVITFWLHIWLVEFLGYRIVTFIAIIIAGILVFLIGQHKKILDHSDALFVALITVSYPAFQTWILLSTANYVFYYALFLLGVFISLKSEIYRGTLRIILVAFAILLFFLSFNLNSLLVFYFGFLLLLFCLNYRHNGLSWKQALILFISRRLYLIFLPFIYWIVKEVFFPSHGLYADYNRFTFSPFKLLHNIILFIYCGVYKQFNTALVELNRQPGLWLFVLLAVSVWYAKFKGDMVHSSETSETLVKPHSLLAYGFLLMGLGMFPYIVVGLSPSLAGWGTRHSLLLALPIALIIVALARLLFRSSEGNLSRIGWMFLTTLLLAFSIATVSSYIGWQARWVKDRSVMVNLTRLDGAKYYSVYWVNDQYRLGGENNYRFYEWSSIFKKVWGDETRIGFDQRYPDSKMLEDNKTYFNKCYNLKNFDPAGCQVLLAIRQGVLDGSAFSLVGRYYYYKFLRPQQMDDFLIKVTDIQIQPLSSPMAANYKGNPEGKIDYPDK